MWNVNVNVNCKCFPPQRETDLSRGDSRRRGSSGKIPGANILTANTRTATTPTRTRRNTRTDTSTDRIQRRMSTYAMSGWVSKCELRMIFLLSRRQLERSSCAPSSRSGRPVSGRTAATPTSSTRMACPSKPPQSWKTGIDESCLLQICAICLLKVWKHGHRGADPT